MNGFAGGAAMRPAGIMLALAAAAMPIPAAAQYETPVNPPDPAAQLAELIEIYDSACLHTFPDDGAVAQAMLIMEVRSSSLQMRRQLRPHIS